MRAAAMVLIGIASGCYQPSVATGVPCAANGACPAGLECLAGTCEQSGITGDAAIDAVPDAMIDACPTAACSGDELIGCGTPVACAAGCSTDGGAHCRELVPSNGITPALLVGATADVTSTENWDFDTDDGEIRRGNIYLRQAGTGVISGIRFEVVDGMGVFAARSFTVGTIDDWSVNGDNPIVLYAATTIDVAGEIDAGASGSIGGPGGSDGTSFTSGSGCRGRAGRFFAAGFGEGGGGGGGRSAGGNGGDSNMGTSAGLGGVLCSTLPLTIPLRGGAGGGHGGASSLNNGGGGGGAIALVAMESITITGAVGAPGDGGESGIPGTSPSGDGGGGGGGGGAVLVEAPFVTISGALTANGGGGAAPSTGDGARGSLYSSSNAAGGSFTGPGGTRTGGRGGTSSSPNNGQTYEFEDLAAVPPIVISRGGGGGGAAGRIEIKSLQRTTNGSVISPQATTTDAVLE